MTQNGELAPPTTLLSSRLARYVHFDRINRPYLHWQVEQFLPYLASGCWRSAAARAASSTSWAAVS
jgi:hypothetical protein